MDKIKKVYIEATSKCNLSCPMCSRNYWEDETPEHMDFQLYKTAIDEISKMDEVHTVFFGGIGEPLCHPNIIEMIKLAKSTQKRVELISNGSLLDENMCIQIMDAQLDMIWVSIDSVEEATFEQIRRGASHSGVNTNLEQFNFVRARKNSCIKLGISFVLMKSNASELINLPTFARKNGASDVKVSNIIPNTTEIQNEAMYERTLALGLNTDEKNDHVNIDLPLFDMTPEVSLASLMGKHANVSIMGTPIVRRFNNCKFIDESNVFIRSDGEVCPCMALLHTAKTALHGRTRTNYYASFGNISGNTLQDIWRSHKYSAFRESVSNFTFSPCTVCGACELVDENKEDCYFNEFPTCGACLWSQGFVQCP